MNRHYVTHESPSGVTRIARSVIEQLWVGAVQTQIAEDTLARLELEFSVRNGR